MKESILREKSYHFALRIVKLYKFISTDKKELVLAKQILRSGTSIGANQELQSAQILKKRIKRSQKQISFTNFQLPKKNPQKRIIG